MDRRAFMGAFGALSATGCATAAGLRRPSMARIPGEWERTEAIWLGADVERPDYMDASARLMLTLLPEIPLRLLVRDEAVEAAARRGFGERGVPMDRIEVHRHPDASYFIREAALFALDQDGRKTVVDFDWNTYGLAEWCARYRFPDQPERARACADWAGRNQGVVDRWLAERTGAGVWSAPIVTEGGGYEVNGRGVLLTGEPMALQRNQGRSRDELEQVLLTLPGIRKVIWLGEGLAEDPHLKATIIDDYVGLGTGGHTDEYVRFADPRTILLAWVDDHEIDDHPLNAINRERMERNLAILSAATDQDGRPFQIIRTPLPRMVERNEILAERSADPLTFSVDSFPTHEGRRVGDRVTRVAAASYLNYLVVNDSVILPTYGEDGTPREVETTVRAIFERAFPGRRIRFAPVTAINWGGGGIHCATLSEMAAVA